MPIDLYEVLEIPENANEIWIRRAYDLKRKAIEADTARSADDRQRRMIAVEKAFNTLSNADSRERYDNRHATPAKGRQAAAIQGTSMPLWAWAAGVVVLLVALGMYWQHSRETERLRIERERIAAEQVTKLREIAVRESGQQDAVRLIGTALDQEGDERHAGRAERERRNQEYQRQREAAIARSDQQYSQSIAVSSQNAQQAEERRQRVEEDARRRQAQAEVDRQKRWLDQKAREEQQIIDRQAAQARADQYRGELEERRNREAEERRSRARR